MIFDDDAVLAHFLHSRREAQVYAALLQSLLGVVAQAGVEWAKHVG